MARVSDDARFRALASRTRRDLLALVADEPQPVGSLARQLSVTQPAVSQHLGVLRDAGLVTVQRHGRHRLYRADLASISEVRQYFDQYWSSAVDRLADVAESRATHRSVAS